MRRAIILLLLVGLAACGSKNTPTQQTITPAGIVPVGGDGQVGQALMAPVSVAASVRPAAAGGVQGVLADTIVTQVLYDTVTSSANLITGPSFDYVGAAGGNSQGASVTYRVDRDGCGDSFVGSAVPDTAGQTKTLWELPGSRANLTGVLPTATLGWWQVNGDSIWAARCKMLEHLSTPSGFSADTAHVGYFTPGPATSLGLPARIVYRIGMDDTVDLTAYGAPVDALGNAWPRSLISWGQATAFAPDTEVTDTVTGALDSTTTAVALNAVSVLPRGWTITVRCGAGSSPSFGGGAAFDSLKITAVVDSVRFDPPGTWSANYAIWTDSLRSVRSVNGSLITAGPIAEVAFVLFRDPGVGAISFGGPTDTVQATGNPPTAFAVTGATSHLCGTAPVREEAIRAPGA